MGLSLEHRRAGSAVGRARATASLEAPPGSLRRRQGRNRLRFTHAIAYPAQITWKLVGQETAYEHFGPPFLLSTSQLYQRVRNIQLRLLPDDELLPHEVSKYDQKVVLEALHNCIAHQDYRQNQRIIVTERPDRLVFENAGHFYEGAPEDYVRGDKTPRGYRNPYLVQAMVELNMIDQMGYGIQRMYEMQRRRYLPMPDYEVAGDAVVMTLYGGVVDPAYTRVLMEHGGLKLADVLALDRVQKGLEVPDEAVRGLKRKGLIEGRKPRYRVSSTVGSGVVGGESKIGRAKVLELGEEIAGRAVQIVFRIVGIDAEQISGSWHQLPKTDCTDR